jgi:hypothetical protein
VPAETLPRHAQIAIDARNRPVVAWDEPYDSTSRVVVARRSGAQEDTAFTRQVVSGKDRAVQPAMVSAGDDVLIAWVNGPPAQARIRITRVPR